jgi:DNA-binding NarL/FixJ family response regulator
MFGMVIAETDDSMRRRLVQALVVERGLQVLGTAPDPAAALDLVCRTKPDLVLVDLGMPQSGGLLLIRAIRLTLPDTVVVIRQGGTDDLTVIEAFHAGAGGFLIEEGFDDHITSSIRLLTPAQVEQLIPTGSSRQRSTSATHRIRAPRIGSTARRTSRCDALRSAGEPGLAGRGTRRLGRCTSGHHRDDRSREPWRTVDQLSHHGRRHL